ELDGHVDRVRDRERDPRARRSALCRPAVRPPSVRRHRHPRPRRRGREGEAPGGRSRVHGRNLGLGCVQRRRLQGFRGKRPGRPPPLRALPGRNDPVIEVERVDYVRVPVDDIEAAKHFYGEVLGLPRNEHLDHEDWVEYETPNVTLAVMTPETHDSEFTQLPPATIALRVPNVATARETLLSAGLEVGEMWDSG